MTLDELIFQLIELRNTHNCGTSHIGVYHWGSDVQYLPVDFIAKDGDKVKIFSMPPRP